MKQRDSHPDRLAEQDRKRLMELSRRSMTISERTTELAENQPSLDDREAQRAFRRRLMALSAEQMPVLEEMAEIAPGAVTITRNADGWVTSVHVRYERIYDYTGEWPQI